MAAQVGALRVAVGADITGLQAGMKRAERQVQRSAGVMKNAVTGINKSFAGLGSVGGLALGGAGLLAGATAFLRVADAAKTMTAQLKLATAEYGSFGKANEDVRAIAERSRTSMTGVAELYATIQRNAGELGNTQAQTARITETVAKSFAVFGATAVQAEQATRQLVQAFQSGRLSGDEFRSLMENAPRLMQLLADKLGVTTGKLREMAEAQTLTSDKMVAAFSDLNLTAELDREFAQLPVTFDQAMTQVYNAALVTFSAFDEGGQFSNSIAAFVTQGSTGFADLEESAWSFGRNVGELFTAVEEVRNALGDLGNQGIGVFDSLIGATFSWRDALSGTLGVLDGVANAFANLYNAPGNLIRLATGGSAITNPSKMRGGFLNRVQRQDERALARSLAESLSDRPNRTPPPFRAPPGKVKKPKRGARAKKPPRDRSEDVEYQFENELRQAQMDILRAQQELAGTAGERSNIALKMLDLEGQMFEAELQEKVRKASRDLAEGKITATAFQAVEAHADALRAKHAETDILKRQVISQEAILHRKEREAALEEKSFENRLDGLRFDDEMATTQADHRRIQLDIVDTLYKQKDAHLRALKAQLLFAGKIEEAADVQAQIDLLPVERGREEARVKEGTLNPIEEWARTVPKNAAEITEALQGIQVNALDGLTESLMGIIDGTQTLQEAFANMARSIINDIIRMIIKMMIFRVISGMLGGGFGAGAGAGSGAYDAAMSTFEVPPFATGGAFTVLGKHGIDNNVLSMNGLPIARVSHGERIGVDATGGAGGQGGPIEVRVMVDASPDLYVKASVIADHRIRAATPRIMKASVNATMRAAGRPKLMGR